MQFRDRREAGMLLAKELSDLGDRQDVLVLGIPRGGVVVAYEVARSLRAPLDVYIARKLGAPHNPELALGAVTSDGTQVLDHELVARLGVPNRYVLEETERQRLEIQRRLAAYRGPRPGAEVKNRVVVLIDDGVATGATVQASLRALRQRQPAQLILAVPVGPADTLQQLSREVDRLVCLYAPELFWAVGAFYATFDQTQDAEVIQLLQGPDAAMRNPAGKGEQEP